VKACGGEVDGRGSRSREGRNKNRAGLVRGFTNLLFWKLIIGYYWRWPLFLPLYNNLGVVKHHVLENKICQTLGDAYLLDAQLADERRRE
jgi:hypothetical protein